MASLTVYDRTGKEVGQYQIDPQDLAPRINRQLLHDAVVMYQANQRQGSHRTKTRGEVAGSTKKMYRQKGTGNARAGSKRSGVRRGGGHIFAKRPRDYSYRLPRKAIQLATRMALGLEDPRQRNGGDRRIEFCGAGDQRNGQGADGTGTGQRQHADRHRGAWTPMCTRVLETSSKVNVSPVSDLNALSVLTPDRILVTRKALDQLKQTARRQRNGGGITSGRVTDDRRANTSIKHCESDTRPATRRASHGVDEGEG